MRLSESRRLAWPPVARRLRVADRRHDVPVLLEPSGRRPVQAFNELGVDAPELELEQIGEQVVIAKPRAPHIERGDERVGVLELLQDPLRSRSARQMVGQRAAHAIQQRGPQQQLAHRLGLALQHLRDQVVGHGPLAARELGHEPLGIGMPGKRDGGQPQARRPPLGALVEPGHATVGELDPGRLQQLPCLREREPEVRSADLDQLARQPQPVQPQARLLARAQHHPQGRRPSRQQHFQPLARLGGPQLVQVVDDEHRGLLERREVRQQPLDQRFALEARRRVDPLNRRHGGGERVDQREPEPLPVPLAALDEHPGGAQSRILDPGPDQHRLAAAGRRAYQHDGAGTGEAIQQPLARDKAAALRVMDRVRHR